MKSGRLFLIGILFAGSIGILVWGLDFLKGRNFLQPEKIFYVQYEKIGGLTISSPITLNGFKVGEVRDIQLSGIQFSEIIVRFVITYPDLELPHGTLPRIYSTDLMGTKGIELLLTDSLSLYSYEDTLTGSIEGDLKDQVNTQMLPLKRKAETLMSSMDSVLVALQLVFDQQNRSNLSQSFEIVAQTLKNFEQTSVFLDTFVKAESRKLSFIMTNMDSLAQNLVVRTQELQNTFINLGSFTDSLNQIPLKDAVAQFTEVVVDLGILLEGVKRGEGSLGKLIVEDSLYYTLEATSNSLNSLLVDIKENPKRYIRLSAVDRGKTYIISEDLELLNMLNDQQNLDYYVCIHTSTTPLDVDSSLFKEFKSLKHVQIGKDFYYYVLQTSNLSKAKRSHSKWLHAYPNCEVYTWLNDQWTRLPF